MENYQTETYKGYTINIYQDDCCENPIKEWDMLGKFACFHRDYDLSNTKQFSDSEELLDFLKEAKCVALPLFLYEHSGITISCSNSTYPFNDYWDSGQIGFVFATYEDIKKEYSCKKVTKKVIEKVIKVLQSEVKTFDDYLTGEVFGFDITSPNGDSIDSCGGYYGTDEIDYIVSECKKTIDSNINEMSKAETFYKNCYAI